MYLKISRLASRLVKIQISVYPKFKHTRQFYLFYLCTRLLEHRSNNCNDYTATTNTTTTTTTTNTNTNTILIMLMLHTLFKSAQ